MATNIFNGAPGIAGYIQSFDGGRALITIKRQFDANGKENTSPGDIASAEEGFLVQQYQVQFQRGTQLQRFLNMKEAIAIVGAGQGTVSLTGMVGKLSAFEKLLAGNVSSGTPAAQMKGTHDVCNPVMITIKDANGYRACKKSGELTGTDGEIICKNAIISSINFTGQIDANGTIMQQATLQATFNALDINAEKKNESDWKDHVTNIGPDGRGGVPLYNM